MSYNISVASGVVSVSSGEVHVMSGAIAANVSGGVTISGGVTVSGTVELLSGSAYAFTLGTLASGGGGFNFSGAGVTPVALMVYDYSGGMWFPWASTNSGGPHPSVSLANPTGTGNTGETFAGAETSQDTAATTPIGLDVCARVMGVDSVGLTTARTRVTSSGDTFRLRTSTEGMAPTYSVTATISGVFSGIALNCPIFGIFNYGSGTAMQSGSAYKIKGLYISNENIGQTSGFNFKFNMMRFTSFSGIGAGTLLSGTAMDTRDPAYSGTLAGPTLFQLATSGITFDASYFSYYMFTGPNTSIWGSGIASPLEYNAISQNTNLIAARMPDTKEIIIRSGYGFGVQQASGYGYTQVNSGILGFNINMIYSVEGGTPYVI